MTQIERNTVVLASGNPGKLEELRSLLGSSVKVVSAAYMGATLPEETGTTFEENAILKARAVAEQTGLVALADDSGLEVDALGGAPGVYSARYAGIPSDDARNNQKLLAALNGVEEADRTARFRCAIAIAFTPADIRTTKGTCEGQIAFEPRGSGGFGYDPLFVLSSGKTMAELDAGEKNEISHRGQAMRAAAKLLRERVGHPTSTDGRNQHVGG
ncbi:MAG TPA: XTP/dITP diphosphatase [Thermomicrobiales bacterium]|nr:XTP/dITP diphosphatase [Thermomicrobiales bacterium]